MRSFALAGAQEQKRIAMSDSLLRFYGKVERGERRVGKVLNVRESPIHPIMQQGRTDADSQIRESTINGCGPRPHHAHTGLTGFPGHQRRL